MKGLGKRIHFLRKQRKITLVEMAKKTGIDQATLSRIENGVMVGTLASHMKIAESLGVSLPDLYKETIEKLGESKERTVRKRLETFSHSSGAVSELLTTAIMQKKMMPVLLKLKARGRTESEELPAGTERFVYVLKGTLQIKAGGESRELKTHESFYLNAALSHHFENMLKSEAWALIVTTPVAL